MTVEEEILLINKIPAKVFDKLVKPKKVVARIQDSWDLDDDNEEDPYWIEHD